MQETGAVKGAATKPATGDRPAEPIGAAWREYLKPLRFDHWIKNLVVPAGSLLALAARRSYPDWTEVGAIVLAFVVSGLVRV